MTDKKYPDMSLDELVQAKRVLAALKDEARQKKRGLVASGGDRQAIGELDDIQNALRSEMLEIQAEQDKRAAPLPEGGHYIGATGISSAEQVGNIGGGNSTAKRPMKKKK